MTFFAVVNVNLNFSLNSLPRLQLLPSVSSRQNFLLGSAGTPFIRVTYSAFADGKDTMAGSNRPNPRDISNKVSQSTLVIDNDRYMSPLVYIWGQVRRGGAGM